VREVAGRHPAIEHWQDATDQGTIAGARAVAQHMKWDGVPWFWTSIGDATLKYDAGGDGCERRRMLDHPDGFTVWYASAEAVAGILTYNADDDYDLGERLIAKRRPLQKARACRGQLCRCLIGCSLSMSARAMSVSLMLDCRESRVRRSNASTASRLKRSMMTPLA